MDPQNIITQLDNHHNQKQLREEMTQICHRYLPFSLSEIEVLSAPMLRLFLTGRSGFDVEKAIVTQSILQRLFELEYNPSRAFELQSVLREFTTALKQCADKKGITLQVYFPTAA
jgi:hypothetical protein